MKSLLATSIIALAFVSPAQAKHRHVDATGNRIHANDPRPSRWCGWWLRHQLGVADRAGNLASWWKHYGSPANGPAVGVIAVWPHHVGIVTGVPSSQTIVLKSGNDGHAVRERERPSRGVIAWRYPYGFASAPRNLESHALLTAGLN